jgi:hypothetical protein
VSSVSDPSPEQVVDTWKTIKQEVVVTPTPFARQITLNIAGSGWLPNEENIAFFFNGIRVTPTPTMGTSPGDYAWTVDANGSGLYNCSIVVPAGTLNGTHRIDAIGEGTGSGAGSRATAPFIADGKLETTTTFIFHNKRVQGQVVVVEDVEIVNSGSWEAPPAPPCDPIAQTFFATQSRFITSLDLFFISKPTVEYPVVVEFRDVVNGIPGKNILGITIGKIFYIIPVPYLWNICK